MLRKPGPATSTALMPSTAPRRVARCVATSRGGIPAPLASCSEMFVDQSPCSRFLGRSTRTSSGTSTVSSPAATASARALRMANARCSGVTPRFYLDVGLCWIDPDSDAAATDQGPDLGKQLVRIERLGHEL